MASRGQCYRPHAKHCKGLTLLKTRSRLHGCTRNKRSLEFVVGILCVIGIASVSLKLIALRVAKFHRVCISLSVIEFIKGECGT